MLFCIILNILRSHQTDLFGSWGVHAHPMHPPAYRSEHTHFSQDFSFAICYEDVDVYRNNPMYELTFLFIHWVIPVYSTCILSLLNVLEKTCAKLLLPSKKPPKRIVSMWDTLPTYPQYILLSYHGKQVSSLDSYRLVMLLKQPAAPWQH